MDIETGAPVLRSELLRAGFTEDELRRTLRAQRWTRLRPGAYLSADDPRLSDPEQRYALTVEATARRLGRGTVVSHLSAAALHGLPLWGVPFRTVHVTRDGSSGGRRGDRLHVHAAPIAADEIVTVGGLPVTCVARTVADVARAAPFETAVVVADAALHAALVTPDDLDAAVSRAGRRRGGPASRRVVAFADGLAEGPGESRSRVRMRAHGLPPPVLQHEVHDPDGLFVGRVDFWWPGSGVVGEFDGRVKYGRMLGPGQDVADVLYAEKLREDAIRAQPGVRTVVRWAWSELDDVPALLTRLRRAMADPT